jgi:WD40 repeat protein
MTGHAGGVAAIAAAPDPRWLATIIGEDQTVQIWDTVTGQAIAQMRVERPLLACTWLDDERLAVGGLGGLYLFSFLPHSNRGHIGRRKP